MGFVGFDDITIAAHGLLADNAHRFADTVRHEPSGLEGDAQTAVKLVARNALLAGAQKIHSLQPKSHRNVAVLKHGSDLHAERLAALVALINAWTGALALKLTDAIRAAAMRADRAVRPHAGFNPGVSGGFVLEGFSFNDRFAHDGRFPVSNQDYHDHLGTSGANIARLISLRPNVHGAA
jgi:hypothetical protein